MQSFSCVLYIHVIVYVLISCRVAERRDAVNSRRQRVKQLSAERRAKLLDSLAWQKFSRDVDEVRRLSHDDDVMVT